MRIYAFAVFCAAFVATPFVLAQSALNPTPSRVVGQEQLQIKTVNPNLLEGREFIAPQQIAIDRSQDPPAMYVADTGNNRVLGWRNALSWSNGAKADVVLGQVDLTTSFQLGPGTSRATGLANPTGVAVDASGNVYVFDSGNNRILRYPQPFATTDTFHAPDMVIGQQGFGTRDANAGGISANTLASNGSQGVANSPLAFDPNGNLYASDPYNNRVLRYSAASLNSGASGPDADLVLGQSDFVSSKGATSDINGRLDKTKLLFPSGLAVDSKGRVYIGDSLSRVLVYNPNGQIRTNQTAVRLLGIAVTPQGETPVRANAVTIEQAEGIFAIGDAPAVVDRALNRVLIYDPPEAWPVEAPDAISPPARMVIGQTSFTTFAVNQRRPEPTASTLAAPVSGAAVGNQIFISDSGNSRVLAFPVNQVTATRVLGQVDFNLNALNLLEGRELFLYAGLSGISGLGGSFSDGAGLAVDRRSEPPHLYIADTYNNRILGYRDARRVKQGDRADLVIGQANFNQNLFNAPTNDPATANVTGLSHPAGVAVDQNGALWVADSGNGRVLRFPDPFDAVDNGRAIQPNLELGQFSFSGARQVDATSRSMGRPFGIAFTGEGGVVVSDAAFHRVLFFRKPGEGDFTNGQAADKVIGQPDFLTGSRTQGPRRLFSPRQVSVDVDDRLYVADAGNNRITIYNRISDSAEPNDPLPVFTIDGLNSPHAVYVNKVTGEIWVGEPTTGRALRYPRFDVISRSTTTPQSDYQVASERPLAITQDPAGTLYVAEGANRVSLFFNGVTLANSANQNDVALAPGTIATVRPRSTSGTSFSNQTASANAPYPADLNDVQVLVDDQPAPLIMVSSGEINAIIPSAAQISGQSQILVVRKSNGQVIAAGTVEMTPVAPALFTKNKEGTGQVAATNEDGTENSASNPIGWGKVITLTGTGFGVLPNAPPDGVSPGDGIQTTEKPRVIVGSDFVPDENVTFSGLLPGSPGVWQIKVKIPNDTVPSNTTDVVLLYKGRASNRGKGGQIIQTTIAVKK